MSIEELMNSNANVSITVTPADLKEFALSLIEEAMKMGSRQKEPEKYLTQKEVAKMLGVSENTLWRWKRTNYLVPSKVGNSVYYRQSDIDALLAKD